MRCGGSVKASFILWPAMRTAREAGRFVYNLLTTLVVDRFGQERRALCFHDNPLAAFEGRELPHVRKWKMNCRCRGETFFLSFENSSVSAAKKFSVHARWMKRQARPGIQESQEFAH